MRLFSAISILLLALSTSTEAQQLKGTYPPVNQPPPPVPEWTALVDQSKVPNAPIRVIGEPCPPVDPFCVWTCTICTRPGSDVVSCPNKQEWGLTYDDGPTNNTLVVLDDLKKRGLKATFFVIGSKIADNVQVLKRAVDEGHQIGIHTWSHTPLTTQTNEQIIAEAKWTEAIIKDAVGLTPKWIRPPQGDFDDRVRGLLVQLGYTIAIWNRDTFDWQSNSDPNFDLNWITGNFSEWVQNTTASIGFISLEHDAFVTTSSMAGKAMDIVVNAKFEPQSLAVCTGDNQPYVENVKLPRSNIAGSGTTTGGTPTASMPPVISKNSSSSIKNNVLLSIVCGLIMTIFGLV